MSWTKILAPKNWPRGSASPSAKSLSPEPGMRRTANDCAKVSAPDCTTRGALVILALQPSGGNYAPSHAQENYRPSDFFARHRERPAARCFRASEWQGAWLAWLHGSE